MLENPILTCRFNNETFEQNVSFRERRPEIGCIYGCPLILNDTYTLNSLYFVIEMNNQSNSIEGIGLITNRAFITDNTTYIYDNGNYNRYIYKGAYRLSRTILIDRSLELYNLLNIILFKGKSHLKRGSGITQISKKLYEKEICKEYGTEEDIKIEISKLFKYTFLKKEDCDKEDCDKEEK